MKTQFANEMTIVSIKQAIANWLMSHPEAFELIKPDFEDNRELSERIRKDLVEKGICRAGSPTTYLWALTDMGRLSPLIIALLKELK